VRPLDQSGKPFPVHCCACLNTTGTEVEAAWITGQGYLICNEHKDIDLQELFTAVWKRGKPV
jgi:hypothetical protein